MRRIERRPTRLWASAISVQVLLSGCAVQRDLRNLSFICIEDREDHVLLVPRRARIRPSGALTALATVLRLGKLCLIVLLTTTFASPFGAAPTLDCAIADAEKDAMQKPMIATELWLERFMICDFLTDLAAIGMASR